MDSGQGGKLRVKTGCKTCRIRRIRCDEGKPDCQRCVKTGRKCDGYDTGWSRPRSRRSSPAENGADAGPSPSPVSGQGRASLSKSPSPRPITLPTFDDDRQRDSFSFFVLCTAATQSSLSHSTDFWSQRVLQLSLSEPAIRYALCSLSALHRKFCEGISQDEGALKLQDEYASYSLEQYTHAVRHTQRLLSLSETDGSEDVLVKGIVACILFICYENLIGNFATAQMHLQNGMRILSRSQHANSRDAIPQDVRRVLSRLDLQAMSFSDSVAPYKYTTDSSRFQLRDPPDSFSDINEAMDCLIHNFRWIFHVASIFEPNPVPRSVLDEAEIIRERWDSRFSSFINRTQADALPKTAHTVTLLKTYSMTMKISFGTGIYGNETLHDNYAAEYAQIVAWGEELMTSEMGRNKNSNGQESEQEQIFSFEPGLIFILFFTAIKCRISSIRWHAIALLGGSSSSSAPRYQEGSWESRGAAAVAEFVAKTEEMNCGLSDGRNMPLESERVHVVDVAASMQKREIQLCCIFLTPGVGEGYHMKEGVVTY